MEPATTSGYTSKETSTETHDWTVEITGDVVKLRASFLKPPCRFPGKRKPCKDFSNASRRAMLVTTSKIAWNNVDHGLFVTLTFPDETLPMRAYRRNQARSVFLRSMERFLGYRCSALWRIEWQPRKTGILQGTCAPHFHLIIFSVPFIPYKKINLWWQQAIAYTGVVATDVKKLGDKRHHAVYIAKYAGKKGETAYLDSPAKINIDGRHWGIHRRALLPRHATVTYDGLTAEMVSKLKDVAYESFPWYGEYAELGFTAFGELGERLKKRIEEICLDVGDAAE